MLGGGPAAADQVSAGTTSPSVTVSSCPTVSRPNASGMKAPIATTAKIVPKKIVAELVCGSIRNGASPPANNRPNDSLKMCPRHPMPSGTARTVRRAWR
jgi:hypothetical protein